MKTNELLFELSHSVRYEIMKALAEGPLKLTKLGGLVGANNPEVSRHLDRLKKALLVDKDPSGSYYTTSFGSIIMSALPYFTFVTSLPEFFLEHDLSKIPQEFMCRLGELESCEIVQGTTVNFYRLDEMSKTSTDKILTVSNEFITKIEEKDLVEFGNALASGFVLRYLFQENQLSDMNLMHLVDHCPAEKECFRALPQVPLFCSICDDEVMISFLDAKGKADFSVCFWSKDPGVMKWCEDLLNHLWENGKPVSEIR